MREETEFRPKPMVDLGGRPILWHIMRRYAAYGLRDFVLCLGYRGEIIKDYFLRYHALGSDFTVDLAAGAGRVPPAGGARTGASRSSTPASTP